MAEKRTPVGLILFATFFLPLIIFAFLYLFSKPVHEHLPYAFEVKNGDTLFYELPEFTLPIVGGSSLNRDDLLGKISLIHFFAVKEDTRKIRTTLHGNLNRTFENIEWESEPSIRFIAINTGDHPDTLQKYVDRQQLDSRYWITAYGDSASIEPIAGRAFHLPEFKDRKAKDYPATSQIVALVDKAGKVRKFYMGTDLAEERRLQEDLIALMRLEYPEELKE